jgi:2-octaprenyl-6-methoxyphenol hydroxylase
MNPQNFDVVISGGGLSGSLMALSLASLTHANGKPLTIAIIETTAIEQALSLTYDDRVLALAHGSANYLQQLDAWSLIQKHACAIKNIHISDRGHYGKARLSAKDHQVNALGYVIEMSLLGKALYSQLKEKNQRTNNITWFSPDAIKTINWQAAQVNIELSSEQRLTASLLLACDGGHSVCRKLANIAVSVSDYQQTAVIANVSCQHEHHGTAFERFTAHGPIAMLPMSRYGLSSRTQPSQNQNQRKNRFSLVWTMPPEQANILANLSGNEFAKQLEQSFGTWLGKISHVGKRDVYPLKLIQAKQQTYHRMALLGNASHAIHPIAGQGFNLGLRDVKQMAQLIEQALAKQQNIGSLALLNSYSEQRAQDLTQVISLTDSLVTLFSNQLPPLVVGRNIGLKALNYIKPFKNALVQKTMGY